MDTIYGQDKEVKELRLVDKMADKVREGLRGFLRITPASQNEITIMEKMNYAGSAAINRVWYRGDADELSQAYKCIDGESTRSMFWTAVPSAGMHIRKIHTGIPGLMVDILTSIVMTDYNGIDITGDAGEWKKIEEDNNFTETIAEAITEALIVGDGAFKITYDPDISKYPILEFVPGDRVQYTIKHKRVIEVIFNTTYHRDYNSYNLIETYGYGYIDSELYKGNEKIELNSIPETNGLKARIEHDNSFIMAIPFKINKSHKWQGRGASIFDRKEGDFDALDEAWSQWMEAVRLGRAKEYIPDSMLPHNPKTGEVIRPNPFDNAYIARESPMMQGVRDKIDVVQPSIPHDAYAATYITALDLALQGIISPSTLGIDVKKLDNAEAQREKEKATLYTRNKIIDALQNTLPDVAKTLIITNSALKNNSIPKDITVSVNFGEYANPSFESQIETVSKGKQNGILSIEASVEELYGDSKDDEWKAAEVKRLKVEQGIAEIDELQIDDL